MVESLHQGQQHEHVIQAIQAAIIHGQSQPWMYEVLAISMEIAERPQAEIERVVLSFADFGTADFGTLMFSAAYLVRLGRDDAGLRLYREATRMLPEQPEPYILGLRLARQLMDVDALGWAVGGVLQFAWTKDYPELHREAENAAAEARGTLQKAGDSAGLERLQAALAEARQRDLTVRLVWSGAGDLDLLVEEPSQTICSFMQRETAGGGILVHDGYGPEASNCYEEYVCPRAMTGDYRIRVQHAWGAIVGRRATLTIIRHQGTPQEQVTTEPLVLGAEESIVRVRLEGGRRTMPRSVATQTVSSQRLPAKATPRVPLPDKSHPAAAELAAARQQREQVQVRRVGAIGFTPVIEIVPDGSTFTARASVSPDRRYVRIAVSPTFNSITDVFTTTFPAGITGGNTIIGGAAGN